MLTDEDLDFALSPLQAPAPTGSDDVEGSSVQQTTDCRCDVPSLAESLEHLPQTLDYLAEYMRSSESASTTTANETADE